MALLGKIPLQDPGQVAVQRQATGALLEAADGWKNPDPDDLLGVVAESQGGYGR